MRNRSRDKTYKISFLIIVTLISVLLLTSCFLIKKTLDPKIHETIQFDYENKIISWKTLDDKISKWDMKILDDTSQTIVSDILLANDVTILDLNKLKTSLIGGTKYKLVLVALPFDSSRQKASSPFEFEFLYPNKAKNINFSVGIKDDGGGQYHFSLLDDNDVYDELNINILENGISIYQKKATNIKELEKLTDLPVSSQQYKFLLRYSTSKKNYLPYSIEKIINVETGFQEKFPNFNITNNDLTNGGLQFKVSNIDNLGQCSIFDVTHNAFVRTEQIVIYSVEKEIFILNNYFDSLSKAERYKEIIINFQIGFYIAEIKVTANDTRFPKTNNYALQTYLSNGKIYPKIKYKQYKYDLESVFLDDVELGFDEYELNDDITESQIKISKQPDGELEAGDEHVVKLRFKNEMNFVYDMNITITIATFLETELAPYNTTYYSAVTVERPNGLDLPVNVVILQNEDINKLKIYYHNDFQLTKNIDFTVSRDGDKVTIYLKYLFLRKFNIGEVVDFKIEGITLENNRFVVRFIQDQFKIDFVDELYVCKDDSKNLEINLFNNPPIENNVQFKSFEINGIESNNISFNQENKKIIIPSAEIKKLKNGKYRVGILYTATSENKPYAYYFTLYKNIESLTIGESTYLSSTEIKINIDYPRDCDIKNMQIKVNGSENNEIVKVNSGYIIVNPTTLPGNKFTLKLSYPGESTEKEIALVKDLVQLQAINKIFYNAGNQYNLYIDNEKELHQLIIHMLKNGNNYDEVGTYGILEITNITGLLYSYTKTSKVVVNDIYIAYNSGQTHQTTIASQISSIKTFYHHGYKIRASNTDNQIIFEMDSTGKPSKQQKIGSQYYENNKKHELYVAGREGFPKRDVNFDQFKIDSKNEIKYGIEFSDDLVDVVSNGFKPITKPGSNVAEIYQKARNILKEIISDAMNDYEKIMAIVTWMSENIKYDYEIIKSSNGAKQYQHPSFFLEGVFTFTDRIAVCDAYTKTLTLFACIEGIEAVRISGHATERHAWSKVRINDYWYFIDSTWADVKIGETPQEGFSSLYLFISSFYVENDPQYVNFDWGKIKQHHQDAGHNKYSCVDTQFILYANLRFNDAGKFYNRLFDKSNLEKIHAYKNYYTRLWSNHPEYVSRGVVVAFKDSDALNKFYQNMNFIFAAAIDTNGDLAGKNSYKNEIWTFYKK